MFRTYLHAAVPARCALLLATAAVAIGLSAQDTFAQAIGYTVQSNGNQHLYRVNLQTGVATDVGLLNFGDAEGISFGPGGKLYGIGGSVAQLWDITTPPGTLVGATGARGGTDAGLDYNFATNTMYNINSNIGASSLYTVNIATGATALVGTSTVFADDIAIRGNVGYAADWVSTNSLYTVNLSTGAFTLVGALGQVNSVQAGSSFAPDGTLYNLTSDGRIYTVNTTTGAATFVAQTTIGGVPANNFEGLGIDIPEPSGLALLGGLVAVGLPRRR